MIHGDMMACGTDLAKTEARNIAALYYPDDPSIGVPYAEKRWPVLLREAMYLISWDRPTTVSVVRRMVGHGLEVVTGP